MERHPWQVTIQSRRSPGRPRRTSPAARYTLVKNVAATNLTNVNGTLYFMGTDATTGAELWKSDGTAAGTVMVKDIVAGPSLEVKTRNNCPCASFVADSIPAFLRHARNFRCKFLSDSGVF
jgi:ELWxxDGT repeat protein